MKKPLLLAAVAVVAVGGGYWFKASSDAAAADAFVAQAEKDLVAADAAAQQAEWAYQTNITPETEAATAKASAAYNKLRVAQATEAAKHAKGWGLSYDTERKLSRMRTAIVMPASTKPGAAEELAGLNAKLQGVYGKGKGTLRGQPINGSDIEAEMGELGHTPAEYAEMWASWHDQVGAPMKDDYVRMVDIQPGRARTGLCRYGRDVAFQL